METQDKKKVYIGCGISEEEQERNYEHHKELQSKVKIIGRTSNYGKNTYQVEVIDETLTNDEVALACDYNLCFGYHLNKYSDNIYKVDVYID